LHLPVATAVMVVVTAVMAGTLSTVAVAVAVGATAIAPTAHGHISASTVRGGIAVGPDIKRLCSVARLS